MKLDIVTPSLSSHSGGVGVAVSELYSNLSKSFDKSFDVKIHSLRDGGSYSSSCLNESVTSNTYIAYKPRSIGLSISLMRGLIESSPDVVHLHGIWMLTSLAPQLLKLTKGVPYIISPHGMMDPWIVGRGAFKKYLAKIFYEHRSWSNASVFHALNMKEKESILKVYPKANVVVVPNGISISDCDFVPSVSNEVKRLLFLGRFHQKKNLISLIEAICLVSEAFYKRNPFVLDIVGWGDVEYENLAKKVAAAHPNRFNFTGPLFGADKDNVLRNADAFILPSFSEGLPMAVLEALKFGVPVLINDNCNLPDAFDANVALNAGTDVLSIKNCIECFLNMSPLDISTLRRASFDFVNKNYSWDNVLPLYEKMYSRFL